MMTILDFQIQSTTPEHYRLDVFARGQSQPLATAEFDYPLSFLTGFELNRLDFDGKDPVGRFERLQTFGHALYQKLFTTEIQRLWQTQLPERLVQKCRFCTEGRVVITREMIREYLPGQE